MAWRWLALATAVAVSASLFAACGDDGDADRTPAPSASPAATATNLVSPTSGPSPITARATPTTGAITIGSPDEGASVRVPVVATGAANVFEAALTVEVVATDGAVLCQRHIQATSGSGSPGTWSTTLAFPPPDRSRPADLRAYSSSPDDGTMVNLVTRRITVLPDHPAIYITAPRCGDRFAPGASIDVAGRALVFEAVLHVDLRDAAGTVVATQRVMAASGTEESPFSTSIAVPPGAADGFYDLVAYSLSARDGAVIDEFSVPVEVRH
jgi:hypothetical protein